MNFGSQTVFDYVRKMITDPDSDEDYHILYQVIQKDCLDLLRSCNLPQEDKDDIIQEVQISVFAGLVRYTESLIHASPAQRNAYLRTILFRRRDDLLARRYRHSHVTSYDADDFPVELYGAQDNMFHDLSNRDALQQALRWICTLNSPPEQIVAYLAARCTAFSGKNSKPALVAQRLAGLSLYEAALYAIGQIQEECSFPIDRDVYAPLFNKLAQTTPHGTYGERRFDLTPRAISNANSQITEHLRKHRNRFIGGNSL